MMNVNVMVDDVVPVVEVEQPKMVKTAKPVMVLDNARSAAEIKCVTALTVTEPVSLHAKNVAETVSQNVLPARAAACVQPAAAAATLRKTNHLIWLMLIL